MPEQPADESQDCQNPNCNVCIANEIQAEAERGLRCMNCLESFDKQYPFQSDEDPTLCRGCLRIAKAPKSSRAGMYGTLPAQRPAPVRKPAS